MASTQLDLSTIPAAIIQENSGQIAIDLAYDLPLASCPGGVIYLSARQQPPPNLLQFSFEAFYKSNIPAKAAEAQIRQACKINNKEGL